MEMGWLGIAVAAVGVGAAAGTAVVSAEDHDPAEQFARHERHEPRGHRAYFDQLVPRQAE